MKVDLIFRAIIFLGLTCVFASGCLKLPPNVENLGCYKDGSERDLRVWDKTKDASMTPLKCYDKCRTANFSYFGLQAAAYCFCGNSYGKYGKVSDDECTDPCTGDSGLMCGGYWKNNIYKILPEKDISGVELLGCYKDDSDRDLKVGDKTKDAFMTPFKCNDKCKAEGFAYFGVQAAGYCFCGNSYGKYGKVSDDECNDPCTGYSSLMCGGDWRNNVYKILSKHQELSNMEHLGCYKDDVERDLEVWDTTKDNSMTPFKCNTKCKDGGFAYFGVQAAGYCFCGNSYGKYGKVSDDECNDPCTGDSSYVCGGSWKNSVYKILSVKQAHVSAVPSSGPVQQYLGCYIDEKDRDMRVLNPADDEGMTPTKCYDKCIAGKYAFYGLQEGRLCFCSNSYGKYDKVSDAQCNIPCTGDSSQKCGGHWRNSVYGILKALPSHASFIGCYTDKSDRDLKFWDEKKHEDMTPLKCYNICFKYPYFAVQAGRYCFCGNSYGKYRKVSSAECNYPCSGDKNVMCGGSWRNSVYYTNKIRLYGYPSNYGIFGMIV